MFWIGLFIGTPLGFFICALLTRGTDSKYDEGFNNGVDFANKIYNSMK